ncbi:MAG: DUF805 domain-containing protein [Roseomonas sp.]|nr:DUF805 domain-containing protein [Roseomonas sp.]
MNFPDAVASAFRNYATFAGRARRSEFWFFVLFTMLAQVIAGIIDDAATGGILGAVLTVVLLIPSIAVTARRLHDDGRSGWWQLLFLLPLIGWIILLVWYCQHGETGPNRFGPDPRAGGTALPPGQRPWPVNR